MNSSVRNAVLWLIILCLVVLVWAVFKGSKPASQVLDFSQLVQEVKDGKVDQITINSATGDVHGVRKNKDEFRSTVPPAYNDFNTLLLDKGVQFKVEKDNGGNWVSILVNAIPFVLLLAFWIFMMRQMQSGGNKALSFRQEPRAPALLAAEEGHVQGRRGRRRGQGRAAGDHRVPARAAEVPEAGRPHSQGRAADRSARHRQDAAGARHRRAKPACRSSPSPVPISSRCSSAWAPAACAICSNRARRTRPASSSSMRSTPWAAIVARAWAAATTSASRR